MQDFEGLPPGDRVKVYEAPGIRVRYDAGRCRHYAECVRRAGEVFDPEKRPWIQPGNADPERVVAAVHACPTGALHYVLPDGPAEEPERPTVITPERDGPLLVRGDLRIEARSGEAGEAREVRAAFCRCGASANKPFCDGSHERIGWHEG
ncbi:(4Fe-4S)-binding protein [Streptacidiphilus fuscans]|uniref:(4Fe-4S)-binding protein n=1 Tax=Streptacidiphilus fuscans TaxID=2789292 RepID=A0A931B2Y9_9ACTN|nr:(4Fe-4S)-binding protein [Streptacidiphilus fuscans]MBF9068011.1 (4Fe-4S)-binding protein [Streptacidiphilus fuscans]